MTDIERLRHMQWVSGWSTRITRYMERIPLDDPQRVDKIIRACKLGRRMIDKYVNTKTLEVKVESEHRTYYLAGGRAVFEIARDWLIIVACLRYLGF